MKQTEERQRRLEKIGKEAGIDGTEKTARRTDYPESGRRKRKRKMLRGCLAQSGCWRRVRLVTLNCFSAPHNPPLCPPPPP